MFHFLIITEKDNIINIRNYYFEEVDDAIVNPTVNPTVNPEQHGGDYK
jgi:hypothetical protein